MDDFGSTSIRRLSITSALRGVSVPLRATVMVPAVQPPLRSGTMTFTSSARARSSPLNSSAWRPS